MTALAVIAATAERLNEIAELAVNLSPEYAAIVAGLFRTAAEAISPSPAAGDGEPESAVERVEDFFREHDNTAATINEMMAGTGLSYQSLRGMIYHRHKGKFHQVETPPGKPGRWRWAALMEEAPVPKPTPKPKPKIGAPGFSFKPGVSVPVKKAEENP